MHYISFHNSLLSKCLRSKDLNVEILNSDIALNKDIANWNAHIPFEAAGCQGPPR